MNLQADFSQENGPIDFSPLPASTEAPKEQAPVTPQQPSLEEILKTAPTEPAKPEIKEDVKPIELNDEAVSNYLKTKFQDRPFEKLDDLFKPAEAVEKVVEKVVDPWEGVIDDEDKAYLNYKRETGRTRKEFEFLNQDLTKLSPLDLAIERVRKDTGLLTLSKEKAVAYLENKLNIDLSAETLDTVGEIELNGYAKPYREALEGEKEKYRTPLEAALKAKQDLPKEEYVELEDGVKIKKSIFDERQKNIDTYKESMKKAADSVTALNFKVDVNDGSEKKTIDIVYELSKEDKHSMLSDSFDFDETIRKDFLTNEGLNYSGLQQTYFKGKHFDKIMSVIVQQARAEIIEELAAQDRNESFAPRPLQPIKRDANGYGEITGNTTTSGGFGVKISV